MKKVDSSFHLMMMNNKNNNRSNSMAFAFSSPVLPIHHHPCSSSSVAALPPSRWVSAPVPMSSRRGRMHAIVDRRPFHTTHRRSSTRCCAADVGGGNTTAATTAAAAAAATKTKTSVLVIGEDTQLGKAMVNEFGSATTLSIVSSATSDGNSNKHKQIVLDTADRAATYDALQALCSSNNNDKDDTDSTGSTTKWVVIVCLPTPSDTANNKSTSSTDDDNGETTSFLSRAKNVIDACTKLLTTPSSSSSKPTSLISRFILLTSLGAGNSESSVPNQVQQALRPYLLDMTDAEAYLRTHVPAASMPWTIVRPAPVDDYVTDSRTRELSDAAATLQTMCYGTVSSAQVAWMVARVVEMKDVVGETVHVVDRTHVLITAPYVRPLEKWESLPFDEIDLGQ